MRCIVKEEEEKKEEMEGNRRDEEEIQYGLVVEEVMMVNLTLLPIPFVTYSCCPCPEVIPAKKQLNKHIE